MRLSMEREYKKEIFDGIVEKILKHSGVDLILKYNLYGEKGYVVVSPYAVFLVFHDKETIYLNVYTTSDLLFDALRQLSEIYEIDTSEFEVTGVRECYD
jgi:hypothetical protein